MRGIPSAVIHSRIKRPFSIYRKMKRKNVSLEDILDFIGVRVIVDTVGQCYEVLGIVHQLWNYIRDEFDDYIALPKPNNYQSIHTAILYPWKDRIIPVEIQIRTHEMHEIAEHGLAAHIIYKGEVPADDPRYVAWVQEIMELQKESGSPDQFFEGLQELMEFEKIYVFTPKGDIVELPKEATPIDFAFRIHTNVGLHCQRARVNGRLVELGYRLRSGDTVEILTHPQQEPSEEWLRLARSKRARHKIRNYLRKKLLKEMEGSIQRGSQIVARTLASFPEWTPERLFSELKKKRFPGLQTGLPMDNLQGFYAAVGEGVIPEGRLKDFLKETREPDAGLLKKILKPFSRRRSPTSRLLMLGQDSPLVIEFRRAGCCSPIPGEEVILYMSQRPTRMPTLHRADCFQVPRLDPERMHKAIRWLPGDRETFPTPLRFITVDRAKMLHDILAVFSAMNINLQHVWADAEDGHGVITIIPLLRDYSMLQRILQQSKKIKGVYEVRRIGMNATPSPKRTSHPS